MWICSIFSVSVFLNGSYFLGLTAVNCAAVNMGVQVSLRILISIVWIETQKWGSGENVQMLLPAAAYRFGQ